MNLFIKNFRVWWQKPADPSKRDTHREISMLELFYDLVYVAIIIQLTHLVAGHITLSSVASYILVFLMMFWAWFNGSLYHELHANEDLKTRVIIFSQMLCLIGMGIFIHSAFGEGYRGFALFYSFFLSIVGVLWWRTGVHDPAHKRIALPFVRLFILLVISFWISLFVSAKIASIIWTVAIVLAFSFTIIFMVKPNNKVDAEQLKAVKNIGESFVERFGLITTIILGEGIISVIGGATDIHYWAMFEIFNIMGCFVLLASIWWLYFDLISRRLPKDNNVSKGIWIAIHFPLLASIGLVNTGILNILEYVGDFTLSDKLIIVLPLIVFLLCCIALMTNVQVPVHLHPIFKNAYYQIFLAVFALIAVIFLPVRQTGTLWLSIMCLLAPIISSLKVWIKMQSELE